MISSLNDQLAVRILELVTPKHDLAGLRLCWLGMGSEGRGEQTIATDQDNGLIFAVEDGGLAPDDVRARLSPVAREVNEAMDRCGYPLCKGGVMAMNPRWCASLDEWKAAFANWIDRGDPDSLLAANVFFDFRPLWGDSILAEALRADIAVHAEANARFLKQMSDNALRNRPPLSWRGELQGAEDASGEESIDLKMNGSVPFVDGARIYALATGVTETNTVDRFAAAGVRRGIPEPEVRAWCDAFEYIQLLRLREQHRKAAFGEGGGAGSASNPAPNPNRVPLAELADLDRRILKEAMRQVRKLQQRLELDDPGREAELFDHASGAAQALGREPGDAADPAADRWVVVDTETSASILSADRLLGIGGVAVDGAGIRLADSFENRPARGGHRRRDEASSFMASAMAHRRGAFWSSRCRPRTATGRWCALVGLSR